MVYTKVGRSLLHTLGLEKARSRVMCLQRRVITRKRREGDIKSVLYMTTKCRNHRWMYSVHGMSMKSHAFEVWRLPFGKHVWKGSLCLSAV